MGWYLLEYRETENKNLQKFLPLLLVMTQFKGTIKEFTNIWEFMPGLR